MTAAVEETFDEEQSIPLDLCPETERKRRERDGD